MIMDTPDLGGDAGRSSQFFISKCYVAEGFVDTVYPIKEVSSVHRLATFRKPRIGVEFSQTLFCLY